MNLIPKLLPVLALSSLLGAEDGVFIVTGYKAFAGRGKNGSETVINALRQDPGFAKVSFVVLDVDWTKAGDYCSGLKKEQNIKGIIGIGEGFNGVVTIEMYGRNHAAGKDEAGQAKNNEAIDAAQPQLLHSRMRYAINPKLDYNLPIVINNNAGDFLCNFVLFHFNALPVPVSGFIHVPPQGEQADDAYLKIVQPLVADILHQNIPTSHAGTPAATP